MNLTKIVVMSAMLILMGAPLAVAQDHPMGFFITSVGMGKGGDVGGLEGADA